MTTFVLKLIAALAMLIDHAAYLFLPINEPAWFYLPMFGVNIPINWYVIGRIIGRIAFPIFAYLIVQGYFKTSNFKKYLFRLTLFAVISELPYRYVLCRIPGTNSFVNERNIIFTLLFGLVTIYLLDRMRNSSLKDKRVAYNLLSAGVIALFSALLILCHGSYSELGYAIILMCGFFYCYGNKKAELLVFIFIVGFLRGGIEFFAILAAPLLWYHNHVQGIKAKYFFYLFYPGHLIVLKCLQILITKKPG